jgi:glutamyl-tRNA reductase
LQRTLRRLRHLSERDREMVEALSSAIVNKMLHYPVTRVKQHTETGRHEQSTEHLLDLFGLPREGAENGEQGTATEG